MKKKRQKKDYAPHITGEKPPRCEADGCAEEGLYKAPKGRNALHEYRFLCLEHIREHNLRWDFFAGMNAEEIEAFMKDAVTGHRPTWERMPHIPDAQEKLYTAIHEFLNLNRKKTKPIPQVSTKIRKALALFEIDYPYSSRALKDKYKQLVKLFHPDRNQGNKLAEEKFKAVANAYKVLENHLQE